MICSSIFILGIIVGVIEVTSYNSRVLFFSLALALVFNIGGYFNYIQVMRLHADYMLSQSLSPNELELKILKESERLDVYSPLD